MVSIMSDVQPSLIRVKSQSGYPVGAGFLIDRKSAITCAHVVNQALSRPTTEAALPDQKEVLLDFPLTPQRWSARARVRAEAWTPIDRWGEGDIAVLDLVDSPPSVVEPAKLKEYRSLWGHAYRVYGFPVDNERGEWARGEVLGPVGRDWVQLESISMTGAAIEEGFSGSPVWDEKVDSVVGMIVAADRDPTAKTGFMIPNQVLLRAMASQAGGRRPGLRTSMRIRAAQSIRTAAETRSIAGMQAAISKSMSDLIPRDPTLTRSYSASRVDIARLVQGITEWCESQAMQVQVLEQKGTQLIQARRISKATWRQPVSASVVPTIRLQLTGIAWELEVGSTYWISIEDVRSPINLGTASFVASFKQGFFESFRGLATIAEAKDRILFTQRALEVADYLVHGDFDNEPDS
jgi:Trypsin-like peptidase domain